MDNYNYLFLKASELAKTFQFLPSNEVDYPFIVIKDSYEGYTPTTTANLKTNKFQVDIWCSEKNRTQCKNLIDSLLKAVDDRVDYSSTSYSINVDVSTKQVLWRGILKVTMLGG